MAELHLGRIFAAVFFICIVKNDTRDDTREKHPFCLIIKHILIILLIFIVKFLHNSKNFRNFAATFNEIIKS